MPEPIIKVIDLWFEYSPEVVALKGVNLSVERGELIALIGQNGSGKTTLAKNINGLLKPTKGKIYIEGEDTADKPTHEIVKKVGYVFQNPMHQIFMSNVYDEVAYGPRNLGLDEEQVRERVEWALDMVGLREFEDHHPYDLDYGKIKLLTVASVISMNTDVLILDEPTTGQDHRGRKVLQSLSKELHRIGKTIIVITHDMRFVSYVAERTILMDDGNIVLDGFTRDVFYKTDILHKAMIKPPQIVLLREALNSERLEGYPITIEEFTEVLKRTI